MTFAPGVGLPIANAHPADIIGAVARSWPPPRAPQALGHERSLALAVAGLLADDARTPPDRPAAPVGTDAKKARTRDSCHSTSARTVAAPESESAPGLQCFLRSILKHLFPSEENMRVLRSFFFLTIGSKNQFIFCVGIYHDLLKKLIETRMSLPFC